MGWSRRPPANRRGNYTVLMLMLMMVLLGFGALSMDISLIRLAQSESQDIADAAALAAMMELKRSGSSTDARTAALEVIAANTVVGQAPELIEFQVGLWDKAGTGFTDGGGTNGVRVEVGRTGVNSVPLMLGSIFNWVDVEVSGVATAANRTLQVVLVMDITGSWRQSNFANARAAAVTFLDELHESHGDQDEVGMVVFYNRYGYEYTPFTKIEASANDHSLIYNKWSALNIGSYAGDYVSSWASGAFLTSKYVACKVFETNNLGAQPFPNLCTANQPGLPCYQIGHRDDFTAATAANHIADGCFPQMPRYYMTEGGTDHTTGMMMARQMFQGRNDPTSYKAMVVLTDGWASGYTASEGNRKVQNYQETRWREYKRAGAHSTSQIETDTPVLAQQMYQDYGINTWMISFVESRQFMADSVTGDGWFTVTNNSAELVTIFRRIAEELPVSIVE